MIFVTSAACQSPLGDSTRTPCTGPCARPTGVTKGEKKNFRQTFKNFVHNTTE